MAVAPRRLTAAFCACVLPGMVAYGLLQACASTRIPRPLPAPAAAAPPGAMADASYDWHGLVIVPFGMLLKEIPVPLHEVLLFRDEAHAGEAELKDCYASERPPPRFVGQVPDEYLLCFRHDRLNRIDASAELRAEESAAVFARACALWLKNAAAALPSALPRCEGREGNVSFAAQLGAEAGDAPHRLSISLLDTSDAAP